MVLVGGTLMRLPAVAERLLPSGDGAHHSVLSLAAVGELLDTLARQQRRDRVARPDLETALADVMLGGTVILATIMRSFGFPECLLSEADLLDGLALSIPDLPFYRTTADWSARRGSVDGGRDPIS